MRFKIGLVLIIALLSGATYFVAWTWIKPKPSPPQSKISGFIDEDNSVGFADYNIVGKEKPVRWKHGWKTSRVTATYRPGIMVGYTIVFDFPENTLDADRAEVIDFFELYDGNIYEGGGYAGASDYAMFKDVNNQEQADKKLQAMLPELTELMENLDNKEYLKKVQARIDKLHENDPKWPDTTPPDKIDAYWQFNNNVNINGVEYLKKEVEPGKWQWVVDEKAMTAIEAAENHKRAIWIKLCTQLMTDKEFAEAVQYGYYLNILEGETYNEEEKHKEREDCFVAQNKMRVDRRAKKSIPSVVQQCTQGITLAPSQSCTLLK